MAKKSEVTAADSGIKAPREIRALVEKFADHRETYRRPGYNETQLRQDLASRYVVSNVQPSATYI